MPALSLPEQVARYPGTRYMGSKRKLLPRIFEVVSSIDFDTAIDAFSGSAVVSYLFKAMGKTVVANDYMHMSHQVAAALIENNDTRLTEAQLARLLHHAPDADNFVQRTFEGLYFSQEDCCTIDNIRVNLRRLRKPHARAMATAALIRACVKRRPRGIFTYTGDRYHDGRKDLKKSIAEHFLDAAASLNSAVFDNRRPNQARNGDALTLRARKRSLVYFDPPYFTPNSDNEYVRRYHFVEGLARDWQGVEIQEHTKTKKFKGYPTPFSTHAGALGAFETLFHRFRDSVIVVSYSSNALPTLDEIVALLEQHKRRVDVVPIEHRYSFGNQGHKVDDNRNAVSEYLFIGQ